MNSSDDIIARVAAACIDVPGVVAVVLGGSRARGWHHAASDIDIGLYYRGSDAPIDHVALGRVAQALDDKARADLASPHGGWGAWMDGGAWLAVEGHAVDLIYRDLDRVDRVIDEITRGEFQTAYHFGHPHGFVSAAYAGELATCRVLLDPARHITRRKTRVEAMPDKLRANLIRRFLDEASFSLPLLVKAEARGDAVYAAGMAFRITACLAQVLFALNRVWLVNEKGAPARVDSFERHPPDFAARAAALTGDALAGLLDETRRLCGV